MKDVSSEYLPSEAPPDRDSHSKVFRLAPVQDDLSIRILGVRRDVLRDKDLSDGSKVLFCYLLDFSLLWSTNRKPGVITISTTKLSEELSRSRRAIYDWKKELVAKRFIWISEWFMPNIWPIDTYHIMVLDPVEQPAQTANGDGMWGNGVRRPKIVPGSGARGVLSRFCDGAGEADTQIMAENAEFAPGSGKKQHLSVAKSATGNRKVCDGEPQNLRQGVAKSATGSRKKEHAAAADNATERGTEQHSYKETQIGDQSLNREGEAVSDPPQERKAWEKKVKDMFPSRLEKLLQELKVQKIRLPLGETTESADLASRIEFVEQVIYGGKVPAKPKPKPVKAPVVIEPKPPTDKEMLEGAIYLRDTGKSHLMTPGQRAALAKYEGKGVV